MIYLRGISGIKGDRSKIQTTALTDLPIQLTSDKCITVFIALHLSFHEKL